MTLAAIASRGRWFSAGFCCALTVAAAGCNDATSGISHRLVPASARDVQIADDGASKPLLPEIAPEPNTAVAAEADMSSSPPGETPAVETTRTVETAQRPTDANTDANIVQATPTDRDREKATGERVRKFAVEGPAGALRVGFDDLDLLKVLRMDPVTPDCVEKMPAWLRELEGKPVCIRGFMKPGLLVTGIPQFLLVRDTGLCCFGPKGKIYDMIAVTLKPGTTTDYIELRAFDVVGTFRIEVVSLEDDGTIFGLYYIDDAQIIRK